MYSLKPIITYDYEVPLPNCMYTLKKINSFVTESSTKDLKIKDQVTRFLKKSSNKMTDLEKRQEKLLEQLDSLQRMVKELKNNCSNVNSLKKSEGNKKSLSQDVFPREIVINASAELLPYSLICLKKLLPQTVTMNISYHIHSSLPTASISKVHDFMKAFGNYDKIGKSSINLRLIFINVGANTEMRISSIMTTPIRGEVNILRYFSFILNDILSYDDDFKCDSILDICHQLQRNGFKTNFIDKLFANLDKDWICGKSMTIADVAVYSILKQANYPQKNGPANVKAWLEKCNKVFK